MPQRRFLIASSLARLIRKEQGIIGRIVEGYFPARPDRDHFISIEPSHAYLVLGSQREGAEAEERTEVPRSQAEALLAVCAGKAGFECTIVQLPGSRQALLQHFIAPGTVDRISVDFADGGDANAFVPPLWFGPEVTRNAAYDRGSLARVGVPPREELPLSNAMLDALLDTLGEPSGSAQFSRMPFPRASDLAAVVSDAEEATPEPAQDPAPPVESMYQDGLVEGLAHALVDLRAVEPTPAETEDARLDLSRTRAEAHRWRR